MIFREVRIRAKLCVDTNTYIQILSPIMPTKCIGAPEFQEIIGVSRNTAARILDEGKVPGAFRLKRRWRIPMTGIEKFMQSAEQRTHTKKKPARKRK